MISQTETSLETFTGEATLVLINSVGFPVSRKIRVKKAELVKLPNSPSWETRKYLELRYTAEGKRTLIGTRFKDGDVAIGRGWQDIKIPESFECFDSGEFQRLVNQLNDPIFIDAREHN